MLRFVKDFRQPYPSAENYEAWIFVSQIRETPVSLSRFPGYRKVDLSRAELQLIHRQSNAEWQSALSSVAGVYLISDTLDGRLYVGSATGQGGIWQRWSDYIKNGHGDNVELRKLVKESGIGRTEHFRYAILEIADIHDENPSVLARESHWKKLLLSRKVGFNLN